ncbi:MAG: anthranilate phosphoribosyltransferase [Candidatus Acidulodesulfobacterium ferriphilum]|uniref:Anthranilate phosphoribosyltransferase n=1 Tax=Candidatus Acidulodesulfobacterium ferriphilum TaxID=2597223 RepID=A0A519BD30_9DELT|nr:MAG: anthranilate phosphoribosyltransferase [Candidatus Acidulodesulfobacterium ferriphilum]
MEENFIKTILDRVANNAALSKGESYKAFNMILNGEFTNAQIGSFLTSLKIKGENVGEIAGAANAMRENVLPIPLENSIQLELVDTCGTGGDCKNTFNISTCAALIAAGAGVKIAKHGNYGVSSKSGSADVLKELGVNIFMDPQKVLKSIEYANIGFLFAPNFHTAMKFAAPARKELGFKTIFNILGPLTNPFGAKKQIIGAYSKNLAEKIVEVLRLLNTERAFVVYGRDGIDEVSLSSITDIYELNSGDIRHFEFNPKEYGFDFSEQTVFQSFSVAENAKIIYDIISGNPGPKADIALLNAGFAILVSGKAGNLNEALDAARYSILSGRAMKSLQNLIEISNK